MYPERRAKFIWAWTRWAELAFAVIMRVDKKFKGTVLWLPLFLTVGLFFLILDVIYNYTIGWVAWGDLKGFTYTQRLKYLKSQGVQEAFNQCEDLNKHDSGHC